MFVSSSSCAQLGRDGSAGRSGKPPLLGVLLCCVSETEKKGAVPRRRPRCSSSQRSEDGRQERRALFGQRARSRRAAFSLASGLSAVRPSFFPVNRPWFPIRLSKISSSSSSSSPLYCISHPLFLSLLSLFSSSLFLVPATPSPLPFRCRPSRARCSAATSSESPKPEAAKQPPSSSQCSCKHSCCVVVVVCSCSDCYRVVVIVLL
jgi:hypothetical protein